MLRVAQLVMKFTFYEAWRFIFIPWCYSPSWAQASSHIGNFLTFLVLRVSGGKPAASAQFLLNPDSSAGGQSHLGVTQERHGWETWLLNFAYKASFSCCKFTASDRRLYFPSKGRCVADFVTLKIHRPRPGLNPRTLGPVVRTLTTRPPRATEGSLPCPKQPAKFPYPEADRMKTTTPIQLPKSTLEYNLLICA
jgi:hypothetical protein